MHEKKAKVISLVPSWTETLIEAGVHVVGRTRFCIHPAEAVKSIPAVGGTKNLKLEEIVALKPDYVILDKEENKLEMARVLQAAGILILVSHVESISSAADFLRSTGELFGNQKLIDMGGEYREILTKKFSAEKFWKQALIRKNAEIQADNLNYVIWKKPFMLIGPNTFIADVFSRFDLKLKAGETEKKYPECPEEDLKKYYCLFSSEPYPFAKEFPMLTLQGYKGALVDGEKISWYGIRNLNFLKACLE